MAVDSGEQEAAMSIISSDFSHSFDFDVYKDGEDEEDWNDACYLGENQSPDCRNENVSDLTGFCQSVTQMTSSCSSSTKTESDTPLCRMQLNDNKAGMQGLDREKINKVIYEASKGSRFYKNEQKKEQQVQAKIAEMKKQMMKLNYFDIEKAYTEVDEHVRELESSRDLSRTIVHIDMDAFYAAVEIRDDPSLKDKPMAVGSTGMLSTSNYAARRYGVRAAMPGFIGKKLCPELVIVPLNFDKYRKVSEEVCDILKEYDPLYSQMSLDEAYLDLTEYLINRQQSVDKRKFKVDNGTVDLGSHVEIQNGSTETSKTTFSISPGFYPEHSDTPSTQNELKDQPISNCKSEDLVTPDSLPSDQNEHGSLTVEFGNNVEDVVEEIRFRIEQKTKLTASAGIAPNLMLAKICTDYNKPNGQYYLKPDYNTVLEFTRALPIRKVCGIGKVTEQLLSAVEVHNCQDLFDKRGILKLLFSPTSSQHFLRISLGISENKLEKNYQRKSMSTETSFSEINKPEEQMKLCYKLCEKLQEDLQSSGLKGKTVTLKLKTVNFEVKTRAVTLPNVVCQVEDIYPVAKSLLQNEIKACCPSLLRLRLMGVRMSGFAESTGEGKQCTITELLKGKKQNHSKKLYEELLSADVDLICPICNQKPSLGSEHVLTDFNRHVDLCLQNPASNIDSKSENPQLTSSRLHDDNNIGPNKSESSLKELDCITNETVEEHPVYTCPICGLKPKLQGADFLVEFNQHVDLCLNKSTIKEILTEKSDSSTLHAEESCTSSDATRVSAAPQKRKLSSVSGSSKKRTLDHFWK